MSNRLIISHRKYQYNEDLFKMCYFTGFQIIGGEKMGRLDLGVFISSITPGGPADLDGCLKPGTLHLGNFLCISLSGMNLHRYQKWNLDKVKIIGRVTFLIFSMNFSLSLKILDCLFLQETV